MKRLNYYREKKDGSFRAHIRLMLRRPMQVHSNRYRARVAWKII